MEQTGFPFRKVVIAVIIGIFVLAMAALLFLQTKTGKQLASKTAISPTAIPTQPTGEIIQSLGFSIDCQVTVTTSLKRVSLEKLDRCSEALDYTISPTKKYAAYIIMDKNQAKQLLVYSLDNNISGQLQVISRKVLVYGFDRRDNIYLLLDSNKLTGGQSFVYYFIPLLFGGYPGNYYKELNTFTDVDKKKVEITLPETQSRYAKVIEGSDGFSLLDPSGVTLYTIGFNDLDKQLSPVQPAVIDRTFLKWDKRIFFSNGAFKTTDIDGTNELTHQFSCDGINIVPIGFQNNRMARSPDGRTLAFLIPTEAQMRDNPNWRNDILAGKNVFNQGELAIFDFMKDGCQRTGVVQSIAYRETFSFSPNGLYIAFVNKGVSLYNLQNRQDYQLVIHNPTIDTDKTAVTGPVVWDGGTRFIYTLVSKIDNDLITSTKLVRIYFDTRLNGTEQSLIPVANDSLYAVSSDGSEVLYEKNSQIYKYDVDRGISSLFTGTGADKINKLVWLRSGTIVSNLWYANENLYFTPLPQMQNFQADFNGEAIAYNPVSSPNQISLFDLSLGRQKFFKDNRIINGIVLPLFY